VAKTQTTYKLTMEEKKVKAKIDRALKRGVSKVASDMVEEIRESLGHAGDYKEYIVYKYGLHAYHQWSSQPGTPPAILTGALQDAINWKIDAHPHVRGTVISIGIVDQNDYRPDHDPEVPMALEFGGGNLPPRPFITPVYERALRDPDIRRKLRYSMTLTQWGTEDVSSENVWGLND